MLDSVPAPLGSITRGAAQRRGLSPDPLRQHLGPASWRAPLRRWFALLAVGVFTVDVIRAAGAAAPRAPRSGGSVWVFQCARPAASWCRVGREPAGAPRPWQPESLSPGGLTLIVC